MRFIFLIIFVSALILAEENSRFITEYEYGAALYTRYAKPSCADCHGKNGEGALVASYFNPKKNSESLIEAPKISGLSEIQIKNGIARHRLTRQYPLSDDEFAAIATYLAE
ncbi:MAG: cytochrome c [Helicobacteraceae bacterium]|jgi:mono/diheme cytochrome c family protein|nr:cytochrome c [Helicobacteraceae bacterium]